MALQNGAMNEMLVTLDHAWLCAAERDIEREEDERLQVLARSKRQSIKGKYELDTAAQLDLDLKQQQLELRKRAARHRQRQEELQLPVISTGKTQVSKIVTRGGLSPQEHQRNQSTKPVAAKPSVYELENRRLAVLMNAAKQPSSKFGNARSVLKKKHNQPRIVDDMLGLERRYARSACRIQQWWRTHLHTQFWKSYFIKVRAATTIQRIVRGFVCRCVVRTWHRNRTYRATRIQAAVRGFFMRRVIQTWKLWEFVNAVRMQSIVRGHSGRYKAKVQRRQIAALRIQTLWRGYTSRRRTNLKWLSVQATELQRFVRGLQTRKRVRRMRVMYNQSAIQIQRVFRGMLARVLVESILRDRETVNRRDWMLVLEAEEEWHRQQRDRLQARLERFKTYEQLCDLEEQYFRAHERINDMESIYLDMQAQRLRISPRAIEHGWVEEMEHKMRVQRELITTTKMDVVFNLGVKFKKKEEEYLTLVDKIREIEDKRKRFEIARDEEFLDYWERECLHAHEVKERERKQRIAATKRRWRVQFYHFNGKRDKRWRGTHWTEEVIAEAKRREPFSLSNTNTLAFIEARWRQHLEGKTATPTIEVDDETATRQRIQEIEDEVGLAVTNAQTEQTMAIFDPVFRDIEKRFQTVKSQQERNDRISAVNRVARTAAVKAAAKTSMGIENNSSEVQLKKEDTPERHLKLRKAMQASRIPWHLLDQLAAERRKLEEEKMLFKVWQRVPQSMRRISRRSDIT